MAVPKQVEETGKKADEMLKAQNDPDKKVEPTDQPKADDPPKDPETDEKPKEDELKKALHRVEVVQGMLDKRNDEYRSLERTLNADIVQRDRTIAEQAARIADLEKKPTEPAKVDLKSAFSEDQMEALEEEGVSPKAMEIITAMVNSVANSAAANQVKPIEERVNTVDKKTQTNSQEAMVAALHREVPDWVAINAMPEFINWLKDTIPGVGVSRQQIITNAEQAANAKPIIEVLREFKQLFGKKADPEPGKKSKMEENAEVIKNSVNLDPNDNASGNDKRYTAKEVTEFYSQAAASGMAYKDPEGYKAKDQDIQRAMREGRYDR